MGEACTCPYSFLICFDSIQRDAEPVELISAAKEAPPRGDSGELALGFVCSARFSVEGG